jgi:hypothetical protein
MHRSKSEPTEASSGVLQHRTSCLWHEDILAKVVHHIPLEYKKSGYVSKLGGRIEGLR